MAIYTAVDIYQIDTYNTNLLTTCHLIVLVALDIAVSSTQIHSRVHTTTLSAAGYTDISLVYR